MKTLLGTAIVFSMLAAGVVSAADTEKKIKMKDLPTAVQQAVKEQSKGATLKGLSTEVEDGQTVYEAELSVAGRGRDVTFAADGKIVSVEDEVAISSIPAAARDAIQKAVAKGKLSKLETVTEKGTTFYEAEIKNGGRTSEVKVDSAGAPVK